MISNILLGIEIFLFVLFAIFLMGSIITGHIMPAISFLVSLAILALAIWMNLENRGPSYSGWESKYDRLWGGKY